MSLRRLARLIRYVVQAVKWGLGELSTYDVFERSSMPLVSKWVGVSENGRMDRATQSNLTNRRLDVFLVEVNTVAG